MLVDKHKFIPRYGNQQKQLLQRIAYDKLVNPPPPKAVVVEKPPPPVTASAATLRPPSKWEHSVGSTLIPGNVGCNGSILKIGIVI